MAGVASKILSPATLFVPPSTWWIFSRFYRAAIDKATSLLPRTSLSGLHQTSERPTVAHCTARAPRVGRCMPRATDTMPPSAGIRVLFVPYNPQSSTEPNPEDKPEISKQKHAAREYHRKAKLSRRTKALGASASSTSRNPPLSTQHRDAAMNAQPLTQARNLPSRNNPRAIRSSPMDVGVGSLDPFNVCVRGNVPSYVHEMLDHGMWPRPGVSGLLNQEAMLKWS